VPTYDYACRACQHRFEAFHAMTEPALRRCPDCGADALERLIGAGAGILFKGSGFYETDYKRPAAPKSDAPPAGTPAKPAATPAPGTPAKAPDRAPARPDKPAG